METFSALLAICVGNLLVTGEFPAQRPMMRSFAVFFDLHLNKWLSKQWRGWWFETLSHPLWRHCDADWPHSTDVRCTRNLFSTMDQLVLPMLRSDRYHRLCVRRIGDVIQGDWRTLTAIKRPLYALDHDGGFLSIWNEQNRRSVGIAK